MDIHDIVMEVQDKLDRGYWDAEELRIAFELAEPQRAHIEALEDPEYLSEVADRVLATTRLTA